MPKPPGPVTPPGGGGGGKEKFLAVAFTDLNGDHKFSANKDALIAGVVDTNRDHIVSEGDTVQFGTYPVNSNVTETGQYTHADSIITDITTEGSDAVNHFL